MGGSAEKAFNCAICIVAVVVVVGGIGSVLQAVML